MSQELNFAIYAIKKNIQNSAELRTSFLTNIFGMTLNNTAFIILWMFFAKSVGNINGWQAIDIIAMLGFGTLCYGFAFSVAGGLMKIPEYVTSGSFDRFMLSPKNLLLRIATSSFTISAIGDVIFGLICLAIYGFLIKISLLQILLILVMIVVSNIVFMAMIIAIYSTSFLFVDANNVTRGLFELFLTPSLFHGGAFQGATRFFFTFIIPSLLIGALPVEIVKNISLAKLVLITILACLWLFLSLKIFKAGIKKYESSNLMTFGS